MPRYSYRCKGCGSEQEPYFPIGSQPSWVSCACGDKAQRRFDAPAFHRFVEHYNVSVGKPISSARQFEDSLKRGADEQAARLGYDHSYVAVYPGDETELGVTEEGLYEQGKAHRESGLTEATKKIFH